MENTKETKEITLDGKPVTVEQLNEAKSNNAIRIVEDKEKPGNFRTLKKMHLQYLELIFEIRFNLN